MFFATFTALALALAGAVSAKPTIASHGALGTPKATDVSVAGVFPAFNIDDVQSKANANTTFNLSGGLSIDAVAADFPATLLLCQATGCASCFAFDLSTLPHQTCLTSNFNFVSAAISQPSNSGLDFGVFVGPPGCATFGQLPAVNTCFNLNAVSTSIVLSP